MSGPVLKSAKKSHPEWSPSFAVPADDAGVASAVCDLEKGKSVCWCFSQPANKNKELRQEEAQCLCRKCLKKEK